MYHRIPEKTLSADQKEALNALQRFVLTAKPGDSIGLYGYAGTGKTTVIQHLCEWIWRTHPDSPCAQVALTAYTHKAVGVLQELADAHGVLREATICTTHSLLGLTPRYGPDGEVVFRRSRKEGKAPKVSAHHLVVIDECSMVNRDLYDQLKKAQRAYGFLAIYMGDPMQLPPVNEEDSPALRHSGIVMEQVVRHGGVILDTVSRLRSSIEDGSHLHLAQPAKDDLGEVQILGAAAWTDAFLRDVSNGHTVKALAWTNSLVDRINSYARRHFYGETIDPFIEGERLVAVETCTSQAGLKSYGERVVVLMHAEEPCTVRRATPNDYLGLPCWWLEVDTPRRQGITVRVFDDSQVPAWEVALREARQIGLATKEWRMYYQLREEFAFVRPHFATTVHKSQGSTYDMVYILQRDLLRNPKPTERAQLLYVAYSRAQRGIYVT